MQIATARRLLALNRAFYATVAEPFNRTRYADSPGKQQLLGHLHSRFPKDPLRVLDVGCGNGRLAWMLEELGRAVDYTGVDGEAQLLARAAENTRNLRHVDTTWRAVDLAEDEWTLGLTPPYTAVVCLATLQHMPGFELRARIVTELAALMAPEGCVVVSAWQFMTSARLAAKQLDWQSVGIDVAEVEPGDALLPWQQEHYAVRYVHQIDPTEMTQLAAQAGLHIETTFFADGREGNLNLYALMRHADRR